MKRIMYSKGFVFVLICVFSTIVFGCKSEEEVSEIIPEEDFKGEYLVDSELLGSYSVDDLKVRFSTNPIFSSYVEQGINVYKITYHTVDTEAKAIKASGLVIIPQVEAESSLISYQHGTITSNEQAPSTFKGSTELFQYGTLLGTAGYVVSAPDYLGYGASNHIPHPYEHASSLATASLDMLKAAKELCQKEKKKLNNKLFLGGYSQGGGATMALHRLIEKEYDSELEVTLSVPGAGAYDKTAIAKYILNSTQNLDNINTYLWVLDTYNRVYGINKSWDFYLKSEYANQVEKGGVYAEINTNPKELFTEEFVNGINEGTFQEMLTAFEDNNTHDWKPKAPVALVHGTEDDFVPFFNSQNAYNAMIANGAENVSLIKLEGRNHFDGGIAYYLRFFSEIEKYKNL